MPLIKVEEKTEYIADSITSSSKAKFEIEMSLLKQKEQYDSIIKNTSLKLRLTRITEYPKIESFRTRERSKHKVVAGNVRGSPFGACLQTLPGGDSKSSSGQILNTKDWTQWREENLEPLSFPVEGFDHMYGKKEIDENEDYAAEAAAIAAKCSMQSATQNPVDVSDREYGSFRTPLDAPIGTLKDKWRVLPQFLQVRSLMRQHIDSFDYFVNTEMKEIVQSPSACEIRSEHDPKFYLRYTDCWVGEPSVEEDSYATTQATPFQCRLRDCTYSAPIYVNIRYTRGRQIVVKKKVS